MPELVVWLSIVALMWLMFVKGGNAFRWIAIIAFFGGLAWILLEEHL